MRKEKTYSSAPKGGKPQSSTRRRDREGTEGNNAIQSQPDDTKQVSMLDSGKHTDRSPFVAGNQ